MRYIKLIIFLFFMLSKGFALPANFTYLRDIDPSILQEIRYAGYHNFVGRPIQGYKHHECILTLPTARALSHIQNELRPLSLSLKVYDCYRPKRAVDDFIRWSKQPAYQEMKNEFYPKINKADVFRLGYISKKSGHSRGSTVDLTIVPLPPTKQPLYRVGQKLVACTAYYKNRYRDNSLDMGTGFDCLDRLSHVMNSAVSRDAFKHRMLLRHIMMKYGFDPYSKEWWHFTFHSEPYPNTYFNFVV